MSTIKIEVPLSVNGIKELYTKIHKIKKLAPKVQKSFITKSLKYMKEQANDHLRASYQESGWYVRTGELESSWTIFSSEVKGILRNMAPYSAFVEYGTGQIGKHPLADVHGYMYNVNAHENGWIFVYDGETHFTKGLEGYWFVYKAVYEDYLMSGMAQKLFDEAFMEVVGRAIR